MKALPDKMARRPHPLIHRNFFPFPLMPSDKIAPATEEPTLQEDHEPERAIPFLHDAIVLLLGSRSSQLRSPPARPTLIPGTRSSTTLAASTPMTTTEAVENSHPPLG